MDVNAYFRNGTEMPEKIVLIPRCCESLHLAHCTEVPYENLDILRDVLILSGGVMPFPEIVTEGRGGLCFELNGELREIFCAALATE